MIDLEHESALTLNKAAKLKILQRNGRSPHIASLFRWSTSGVRGVTLETAQVAGSRCTTVEAVERFIARLSGQTNSASAYSRSTIRRQHERAEKELAKAGI